jgi:glucose-1-phosphate thymidylyltransferase
MKSLNGKLSEKRMIDSVQNNIKHSEIIGLIPAAGIAARISPLPCSKELYPVGFRDVDKNNNLRPKVVCHYLLEKMQLADVTKVFMVLREGKWDIPAYFGNGKEFGLHLAYLMMNEPFGVPFTLDQAYPFIQEAEIVFGFPDIIFRPDDAFVKLLAKQAESGADLVLGLFPASQPNKMEMVGLDGKGQICEIQIKPTSTNYLYTWIIAVWAPPFTHFMHEYVAVHQKENNPVMINGEVFFSDVINAALKADIQIDNVVFDDGTFLDIGIPENLAKAAQFNTGVS